VAKTSRVSRSATIKTIPLRFGKTNLEFAVTQRLFSSFKVDAGTRFLLRLIASELDAAPRKVLDIGCGYGPLGIAMVSAGLADRAHMVDRDALAVEYSRRNAELNAVSGEVETYGSLGYSDVPEGGFDLIVSNIPGKAGPDVIESVVLDSRNYLAEDGSVACVVVSPLGEFIDDLLASDDSISITAREANQHYVTYLYRFNDPLVDIGPIAPDLDMYYRGESTVDGSPEGTALQTARGVEDFEIPGHGTALLVRWITETEFSGNPDVFIYEPGQGHVPLAAMLAMEPASLALNGHDLLALRYSRHNLVANGLDLDNVRLLHTAEMAASDASQHDLLLGRLRGDETATDCTLLAARSKSLLKPEGTAVFAGPSTFITRLEQAVRHTGGLSVGVRRKHHGYRLLAYSVS
jgi:16S rRNA (guanine1207-N2)-methyltransferase